MTAPQTRGHPSTRRARARGPGAGRAVSRDAPARAHTKAVRLPSATTATTKALPGLGADVDAVSRAVTKAAGPVVVIAHSYGGPPATEAAARHSDKNAHLVSIAACAPGPGQNLYAIHGLRTPDEWPA